MHNPQRISLGDNRNMHRLARHAQPENVARSNIGQVNAIKMRVQGCTHFRRVRLTRVIDGIKLRYTERVRHADDNADAVHADALQPRLVLERCPDIGAGFRNDGRAIH